MTHTSSLTLSVAGILKEVGTPTSRDVVTYWYRYRTVPTSEAVVPGSNLASLTVENFEDRQGHSVYCKIFGYRRGNLNLRQKRKRKQFKETILPDSPPFTYVTQLIPYLKKHFLFIIKKPALSVKNGCKLDT